MAKIIKNLSNLNRVIKEMREADNLRVVVGAPDDLHDGNLTDGQLLAFHEYGTPTTPERPVLRSTMREERKNVVGRLAKDTNKVIKGSMSARKALARAGLYLEGKVKKKFGSSDLKPLAPATIEAKGSSKPLIDTGRLRASITSKVVDKSEVDE